MNTKNLIIADPYNDNHIRMLSNFEDINNMGKTITSYLNHIKSTYDKRTYDNIINHQNEFHQIIFSMYEKERGVKDSCYLKAERDRKVCELSFAPLKETQRNRQLITDVCNYSFNILGMEQIFVSIDLNDRNLIQNLESKGFENIGQVNGKLTFIRENENIKEVGRVR